MPLACCRRTKGTYQKGEQFTIVDDWSNQSRAHAKLAMPWQGTTFFVGCPGSRTVSFAGCKSFLSDAPGEIAQPHYSHQEGALHVERTRVRFESAAEPTEPTKICGTLSARTNDSVYSPKPRYLGAIILCLDTHV